MHTGCCCCCRSYSNCCCLRCDVISCTINWNKVNNSHLSFHIISHTQTKRANNIIDMLVPLGLLFKLSLLRGDGCSAVLRGIAAGVVGVLAVDDTAQQDFNIRANRASLLSAHTLNQASCSRNKQQILRQKTTFRSDDIIVIDCSTMNTSRAESTEGHTEAIEQCLSGLGASLDSFPGPRSGSRCWCL